MNCISGQKDTTDTSCGTSSLANIMMSEMAKVRKNSIPVNISDKKKQSESIAQNK